MSATETSPRVSVCIANYNGARFLRACLDSVFQQDWNGELEVIVHDDASTDGSLEILAAIICGRACQGA